MYFNVSKTIVEVYGTWEHNAYQALVILTVLPKDQQKTKKQYTVKCYLILKIMIYFLRHHPEGSTYFHLGHSVGINYSINLYCEVIKMWHENSWLCLLFVIVIFLLWAD